MKRIILTYFVQSLFMLLVFFTSCTSGQENNQQPNQPTKAETKERLIRANKLFMNNQADDIDEYIKGHGLKMDTTATGLRIAIERTGKGPKPGKNNTVTVKYTLSLIDGTECYRSDSLGLLTFSMSYDDVPQGLREAVSMMSAGDKALAILPSHLGYGLTGDRNKVPSNAALIYQVELVKIE